uniref:Glycosyltransferase 2-like domain-containing protein n=1 Tax=Panagrolaimus sp. JU765 TaxID=591449 RepID=A0AC34R2C2_9BILA
MLSKFQQLNIPVILGHGDVSGGVGYAKNRACLQSTGEFLCFLDSDDVMEVDRLRLQYEAALSTENNGEYAFVGSQFTRKPEGSTGRYARWACNLSNDELQNQ